MKSARDEELTALAAFCLKETREYTHIAMSLWSFQRVVSPWRVPGLAWLVGKIADRYERKILWWSLRREFFLWMRDAPSPTNSVDPQYCTAKEAASAMGVSR